MNRHYNRAFHIGLIAGFLVFAAVNLYTGIKSPDHGFKICFDCYETYGFPFVMHESGSIAHLDQFVWSGVVANTTVAVVGSMLVGLLANHVWTHVQNHELK